MHVIAAALDAFGALVLINILFDSTGGEAGDILTPYFSARLSSQGFSFKYGRVEIRAKMPKGDWIWPGTPSPSSLRSLLNFA